MNGKTASWEAVVLLDFVDEKKLIEALKPIESKLTPEEKQRNSYGHAIKFIHNPQIDHVFHHRYQGFSMILNMINVMKKNSNYLKLKI